MLVSVVIDLMVQYLLIWFNFSMLCFCLDIDECATNENSCAPDQTCRNKQGGYTCFCQPGHEFNKNSQRCEDINECEQFKGQVQCLLLVSSWFNFSYHPTATNRCAQQTQNAITQLDRTTVNAWTVLRKSITTIKCALMLMNAKTYLVYAISDATTIGVRIGVRVNLVSV